MKSSLVRVSKLRAGDVFLFTPLGAKIYLKHHPGAPVNDTVFLLMRVMHENSFYFYGGKDYEIVRYACLYDYKVKLLWRGGLIC